MLIFYRRINEFIIGSKSSLKLEIKVTNTKESAYLTTLQVKLPENIELLEKPIVCDETYMNTTIVTCEVDNPLEPNVTVRIGTKNI